MPELRRSSQRRKALPPGTPSRQPHSTQCGPTKVHAVGQVPGLHTHTNRDRDTRVAELRLPTPGGRRPREGRRLTPNAPHNGGRPSPPGTAPHHPRGTQPPQGEQAKKTVLGPHTRTPIPTASGWWIPTARPEGGQPGEGERLTSDAPHTGDRHPPRGRPPATSTAHNAPLWPVLGADARNNRTRDTQVAEPRLPTLEEGRLEEGQRLTSDAPHNGGRQPPPGDGPPPPPRHAAPTGRASQGDSTEEVGGWAR